MREYKMLEILIELDMEEFIVSRRVLISDQTPLNELHWIIQILYGWKGYHMHQYFVRNSDDSLLVYFDNVPEFYDRPYNLTSETSIEELLKGNNCEYIYDMGDYWEHKLTLVNVHPNPIGERKVLCIDGKNSTPPEDVGGVGGYLYFLKVMADKTHPDYDHLKSWSYSTKTPKFNITTINKNLTKKYG